MESLQKILENCPFQYEMISHSKPIYSAQEGASFFGIQIGQTAPALILKTEMGLLLMIASGDRGRIEFPKVAQMLDCRSIELAKKDEVKEATGFSVGSIPLIGIELPCIMDKRLFQYQFVYGGSGEPRYTLKIEPRAIAHFNKVVTYL